MEQKLHPHVIQYWQMMFGFHTFKWMLIGSIPLIIRVVWLTSWMWLTNFSLFIMAFFFFKGTLFICYGVYIKYARRSYMLSDDEIMIRWGTMYSDNSSIIPLSRVQHVDREQDMLAKRLGLSELTITTAGDYHYIVGLAEEEAVRLRRQIIELSKLDDKGAYYD